MMVTTLVLKFQLVVCTPHRCKYVVNIATNTPSEKRQKKACSIIPIPILLSDYVAGRCYNPDLRAPLVVTTDNEAQVASQKNLIWSLARQQDTAISESMFLDWVQHTSKR